MRLSLDAPLSDSFADWGVALGRRVRQVADIVHFQATPPVLHVSGDEDATSQGCRRPAISRAFGASGDLVVDLSGLAFADRTVMLDLAVLARRLRQAGRQMRLYGARPQVARLIEAVGLQHLPSVVVVPLIA